MIMVVAQPGFDKPEVVSFFPRDVQVGIGAEYTYPKSLTDALAKVQDCISKGARPTGNATRALLSGTLNNSVSPEQPPSGRFCVYPG